MFLECGPGFIGWNCTEKCPENYYGRKCLRKCSCNETQICHPVCGCLQRLASDNSYNDTILLENVVFSSYAEKCPTTSDTRSTTTGLIYCFLGK